MFDRFRHAHSTLHDVEASDDEHLAALELMLLVALADRTLTTSELEQVEHEVESGGWETSTFNYSGKFGPAMAEVRNVSTDDASAFIEACAARISTPALREQVRVACHAVALADGTEAPTEHEVLKKIDSSLT